MASNYDKSLRHALENEVVRIYKQVRASDSQRLNHRQLCILTAQQPASRFFLNPRYALDYCRKREQGVSVPSGRSYHHSLLEAFYDIVKIEIQNANRYDDLKRVITRAMLRPAPSLGLSPCGIQQIIHRKLHLHHKRPNHAHQ